VSALVRYVAQDVCQQINDNMPVPNTSPGPSTSDHSQSELSQNKLESLVIDQNKMPLGWSFYHHSEHGLLLIDESWLILYWWKLHYKNKSDQVPLLIGIPIELSDLNYQNFESWRIIFSDLSLDIHLSEKKQLIIRAVPQAMNDLNIYTMLTPLLAFTANEIKNYLECDILPEVLHPSNKPLPKNHLDYLIKKCFKGEQIRGPIRTWHSLESWWRQQ
jgi:hypothetical protein